jgi:hypothetical protein
VSAVWPLLDELLVPFPVGLEPSIELPVSPVELVASGLLLEEAIARRLEYNAEIPEVAVVTELALLVTSARFPRASAAAALPEYAASLAGSRRRAFVN